MSINPTSFIAIPRRSRYDQLGLGALSAPAKRTAVQESLQHQQAHTLALEHGVGLENVSLLRGSQRTRLKKAEKMHSPQRKWSKKAKTSKRGYFEKLELLDTFVVDMEDEAMDDTRQFFQDDYFFVPNIRLDLPAPLDRGATSTRRRRTTWSEASGVVKAHQRGIRGQGVNIGVLDTGCDADHRQFRHKTIDFRYVSPVNDTLLREVRGFDVNGHGTHVCGILCGEHVGVAPEAHLAVASVIESESTTTSLERLVRGLDWMLQKFSQEDRPALINMSLGFIESSLADNMQQVLLMAIRSLVTMLLFDFDILPIVAIGNEGAGTMRVPGAFAEVLSVGAVDDNHIPADFSGGGPVNGGPRTVPDLVGYGVDVYSALERNLANRSVYGELSGTSMATPYVTGIAALYASQDPALRGTALKEAVLDNVLPLPSHPSERVGRGLARLA